MKEAVQVFEGDGVDRTGEMAVSRLRVQCHELEGQLIAFLGMYAGLGMFAGAPIQDLVRHIRGVTEFDLGETCRTYHTFVDRHVTCGDVTKTDAIKIRRVLTEWRHLIVEINGW